MPGSLAGRLPEELVRLICLSSGEEWVLLLEPGTERRERRRRLSDRTKLHLLSGSGGSAFFRSIEPIDGFRCLCFAQSKSDYLEDPNCMDPEKRQIQNRPSLCCVRLVCLRRWLARRPLFAELSRRDACQPGPDAETRLIQLIVKYWLSKWPG